ncbi:MAG: IS3 family transposase, partial [Rhodobacteraceae bacterium]|nr:IS3 family transposase [Paracoccaceae bacterium]
MPTSPGSRAPTQPGRFYAVYPDILVVDNGPELRGRALDGWADDHGVQLYFIDPGKPTQNA